MHIIIIKKWTLAEKEGRPERFAQRNPCTKAFPAYARSLEIITILSVTRWSARLLRL
jgi:hypothetical protein